MPPPHRTQAATGCQRSAPRAAAQHQGPETPQGGTGKLSFPMPALQKHEPSILHPHPESPRTAPASSLPGTWSPTAHATKGHRQASPQPRRSGPRPQQAPLRPPRKPPAGTTTANCRSPGPQEALERCSLTAAVFLQHLSATGNQERRAGERHREAERWCAVPAVPRSHRTLQPGQGPRQPRAACPGLGASTDIGSSLAPQTHPWGEPPGSRGSGPCPEHQWGTARRADTAQGNSRDAHAALHHTEPGTPPQHRRGGRDQQLSL